MDDNNSVKQPPKSIQLFCTYFFGVSAVFLMIYAMSVPPHGEIHPSVLMAGAMFLTFIATMFGFDYHFRINMYSMYTEFMKMKDELSKPQKKTQAKKQDTV